MNLEVALIIGTIVLALVAILFAVGKTLEKESVHRQQLRIYAWKVGMTFTQVSSTLDELGESGLFLDFGNRRLPFELRGSLPSLDDAAPRIFNQLEGEVGGRRWKFLDVMLEVGSDSHRRRVPFQILTVELEEFYPELVIQGDRGVLSDPVGEDIDFESETFNRKYHVSSDDRAFAYGVLTPAMIEWLVAAPVKRWHLNGNRLSISEVGPLTPKSIAANTGLMLGFLHRIPKYLRDDYGVK